MTSSSTEAAWRKLWECMRHHWWHSPNDTPQFTLNRLFRKRLGDRVPLLDENSATLSEEMWPMEKLAKLNVDIVSDPGPVGGDPDSPIVVVRYEGVDYRLDGRRRIWRWCSDGDTSDHPVLLLTVK